MLPGRIYEDIINSLIWLGSRGRLVGLAGGKGSKQSTPAAPRLGGGRLEGWGVGWVDGDCFVEG